MCMKRKNLCLSLCGCMRGRVCVCVSVLWLTQTSLYVTALEVHQRGCQGTSLLFDSIHDTWAAIYNECRRAAYLISSAPSLQIHAPQITCVRNGTFARMTWWGSVFPWDVRRIMKSVIPIAGLTVPLSAIVDLSSAFGGLRGRMQARRELCCRLHASNWIQSNSSRSSCYNGARHGDIWVPTDHLTACARQ